jgi:pilus assembly protein TadC
MTKVRTIELFALVLVIIILVVVYPQNIIFMIFSIYAASGLIFYLPRILFKRKNRAKQGKTEEAERTDANDV